jgi:DNA-binding LacI/PurR family transcriptional regulator
MPQHVRSTSIDVARRAGVSRATVSYVLNGRDDQSIPESTRQRVLAAAHDLSYVPHAASRALRAGRSPLVLLVNTGVPWSTNVTDLEDALTALVAGTGRSLVVWRRQGPADLASTLSNLEPCVAIALDTLSAEEGALLASVQVPLLEADMGTPNAARATQLQVQHLVAHGHRRIGYLTGFLAACARHRLPVPETAALAGGTALDAGAVAGQLSAWRSGPDPITAVACFNDLHAAACLAAAADLGLVVPADLAVMGLDDDIFAPLTRPPLTTIRLEPGAFAEHLWHQARHLFDDAPAPPPFDSPSYLVSRASV